MIADHGALLESCATWALECHSGAVPIAEVVNLKIGVAYFFQILQKLLSNYKIGLGKLFLNIQKAHATQIYIKHFP